MYDLPILPCCEHITRKKWKHLQHEKALSGEIKGFTGIDSPYEAPESPDIVLNTSNGKVVDNIARVVEALKESHIIKFASIETK